MTSTTVMPRTYSVNIRRKAAECCGLTIKDQPMTEPITAILMFYDKPVLFVNIHMSELQKRQAIANTLATCIKKGQKVNCIVTHDVPEDINAIARRLLMPEKEFLREATRLQSFGAMRYSILSTLFQTPLAEVMLRARDLGLAA